MRESRTGEEDVVARRRESGIRSCRFAACVLVDGAGEESRGEGGAEQRLKRRAGSGAAAPAPTPVCEVAELHGRGAVGRREGESRTVGWVAWVK